MGTQTCCRARNASIGTGLIICTPTKHPHILSFVLPIFDEMFLSKAILINWAVFALMLQAMKESLGSTIQYLGVMDFGRRETASEEA